MFLSMFSSDGGSGIIPIIPAAESAFHVKNPLDEP